MAMLTSLSLTEAILELLRLHVHSLRAIFSISEFPLVLRQAGHDRIAPSTR